MGQRMSFLIAGLMVWVVMGVWAEDGVLTETLPEGAPQMTTVAPQDTDAMLPLCRYPRFEYSPQNDHPACEKLMRTHVSLTPRPPNTSCPNPWQQIDGLTQSVTVPSEYRNTAALMVTWTVRVEGLSQAINPGTDYIYDPVSGTQICGWWHGTSIQSFPGGKVQTRLLVDGVQMPANFTADMTMPDGGGLEAVQEPNCGNAVLDSGEDCDPTSPAHSICPPYPDGTPGPACNTMSCLCKSVTTPITDPTITGSVVLKPSDFASGKFPETEMQLNVQWNNDTCMTIRSKKNFRSMIVTLLPQGNQ